MTEESTLAGQAGTNTRNPMPNASDGGHRTVLLEQAIAALAPTRDGTYIDATFGGGGHTRALLDHPSSVGMVYAIDADGDAIDRARTAAQQPRYQGRLVPVHGNFGSLRQIAETYGIDNADGLLMDLGLSSFQLDQPDRGFAFRFDAPLDMRFDRGAGQSARDLVNDMSEADLASIIWTFGQEPKSRQIAAAIVRARSQEPIATTKRLADVVERAVGGRRGRATHPATRTFQAIRIETNAELESLAAALKVGCDLLAPGARLVVISFHSLEDRLVKRFIAAEAATCVCPPTQPVCTCDTIPRLRRIGGAVKPTEAELDANPRSRSAIMRVAERLAPDGQPVTRGG